MSEDYRDLVEPELEAGKEPTPPEKEIFKSLYIRGEPGKNQAGIMENPGNLQIRGFDYNLDKVNMIVMLVKKVLVNRGEKGKVRCFCFKPSDKEWYGITRKKCGETRADRQEDPFCASCREEIIVAGIHCDEDGNPIKQLDEESNEKKPVFVFIRGKGIKYGTVNEYVSNLIKLDFGDPVFDDEVLEKQLANRSRVVTEVTVGMKPSSHSNHYVFNLQQGKSLSKNTVTKILNIAKKHKEDFNNKFDWSRTMKPKRSSTNEDQSEADNSNAGVEADLGDDFDIGGNYNESSPSSNENAESKNKMDDDPFSDAPF